MEAFNDEVGVADLGAIGGLGRIVLGATGVCVPCRCMSRTPRQLLRLDSCGQVGLTGDLFRKMHTCSGKKGECLSDVI